MVINQNEFIMFVRIKQIKLKIMKKITLVLFLMVGVFSISFGQIAKGTCKNTCEVEKIVQEGTLLGVRIQGISCGTPGVRVIELLPNTAAEKFGFKLNDVILSVDGEDISTTKQLVDLVASHKPSDLVSISFLRAGEENTEDVILGAKTTKIVKESVCCDAKEDKFFNTLNMSLYPNPANTNVNFSMDRAEAGKYTFQVFNTIGEQVYVQVENFEAAFSKNIDLTDLASGEYFLKITKGANTLTKAFIVAK